MSRTSGAYDGLAGTGRSGEVILTEPSVDPDELRRRTGWELKPEGLCRGDRCVPVPRQDGPLDVHTLAERLQAPLVHDPDAGLWALGPSTGGRALETAELPHIVLPDIRTGEPFDLRSLRGQRVLLIAWASW